VYLGIVQTESESPRLSQDLMWDCDLGMQLLDESVGVFAITSLGALSQFSEYHCCFFSMCTCRCHPSILVNAFHSVSFLHFRYSNCSR